MVVDYRWTEGVCVGGGAVGIASAFGGAGGARDDRGERATV